MKGKLKKLVSFWLVAMMLFSFIPAVSAEITGEGMETSPHPISTVSDLQSSNSVGLSSAASSVTITLTYTDASAVTDATVKIENSASVETTLSHQGGGVYSATVTTNDETYTVTVNGESKGTITQVGSDALEASYTLELPSSSNATINVYTGEDALDSWYIPDASDLAEVQISCDSALDEQDSLSAYATKNIIGWELWNQLSSNLDYICFFAKDGAISETDIPENPILAPIYASAIVSTDTDELAMWTDFDNVGPFDLELGTPLTEQSEITDALSRPSGYILDGWKLWKFGNSGWVYEVENASPKTVSKTHSVTYDDFSTIQNDIKSFPFIVLEPLWSLRYKIDPQPTSNAPTVGAKETLDEGISWQDTDAAYQWHNFSYITYPVVKNPADDTEIEAWSTNRASVDGGKWTSSWTSASSKNAYVRFRVLKDDIITVKFDTEFSGDVCADFDSNAYTYNSETDTYTYTATEDATIYAYIYPDETTATSEATFTVSVSRPTVGSAVSGATSNTFSSGVRGNKYVCKVTFENGDVLTSDVIEYILLNHTVQFFDHEGNPLNEQVVPHGGAATAPSAPAREGYKFVGWDVAFNNVTSNLIVTAQYAEKTTVSVSETAQEYPYDNTEKAFEIKGTSLSGFTVKYQQNGTDATPKNAGSYDVIITRAEDDTYKAYSKKITNGLVINKADVTVTAPTAMTGLVYNNDAKALISAGSTTAGTMQYAVGTNSTTAPTSGWNTSIPEGRDAGIHYVWYKVVGNANYNDAAPKCISVNIAKANAVITVDTTPIVVTYGDTLTLPSAETNFGTVTADKTAADMKNVGDYTVTYTVAGTNNWNGDTKEVSVKVNPAKVTKPAEDSTAFIYSGNEQTYTIAANSLYTVSGNKRTDAGIQAVTVALIDNHNYTWEDGTIADLTFTFEIAKVQSVITVDTTPIVVTYGDTLTLPSAEANFGTVTVDMTAADMKNVGDYTVTYTVAGTNNWYGDTKEVSVTVNRRPVKMTWSEDTFVYDESEKTITAYVHNRVPGDPSIEVTLSGNVATNANEYIAKVVAISDDNYTLDGGINITKVWKITQATNSWNSRLAIDNWTYGETPVTPRSSAKFGEIVYTYSNAENGEFVAEVPKNAGRYWVKAEVIETPNFTGISQTEMFRIKQAVPTVETEATAEIIRHGDRLSDSSIHPGVILGVDGPIEGTYAWEDGSRLYERDGKYVEVAIFTPDDSVNYESISFKLLVEAVIPKGMAAETDKSNVKKPVIVPDSENEGDMADNECGGIVNCPSRKFLDLDTTAWYHLSTDFVIENGIFKGTSSSTFAPNGKLSRAMLVTVLYRMEGSPAVTRAVPFEDVDMAQYYADAVIWAKENDIVNGMSSELFAPNADITREQMSAIMHRYAKFKGYEVSKYEATDISAYYDASSVSEYAIIPMKYAVGCGLIKGKTSTTLNPKENATRAETATIIKRFIDMNK